MKLLTRPITRFLLRRMLQALGLIFLLIACNFFLIHLAPGDPTVLLAGESGDAQYYGFIRAKFGLDQPLASQFWRYLHNIGRGDFGYSLNYQQPVTEVVFSRLPATLLLMLSALIIAALG